jgi:thioredoxin reductase
MAELWGSAIHHCPYCHGWEIRDQRLGLYAAGERAPMLAGHLAPLLRNLTADLVLLTDGPAALDAEARAALDRIGVLLDERRIERLERDGDTLRAVVFTDGSRLERDALFAAPTPHPRTALGESLGCAVIAPGEGMLPGLFRVDMLYQTSVAGVWAVGDVAVPAANVPLAIASGTMAGAAANLHLAKAGLFAASPVAA